MTEPNHPIHSINYPYQIEVSKLIVEITPSADPYAVFPYQVAIDIHRRPGMGTRPADADTRWSEHTETFPAVSPSQALRAIAGQLEARGV